MSYDSDRQRLPDGIKHRFEGQTVDIPAAIRARRQARVEAERQRRARIDTDRTVWRRFTDWLWR